LLKVTDRWTTQYGSWDVDPSKPYGIDKAHRDKYLAGRDIPGAGADHHIFVRVPEGAGVIEFATADGRHKERVGSYGNEFWVSFPIFRDSAYNPKNGEVGPWLVRIDGEKVAEGIGLPGGEHVSTFLVVEDVAVVVPDGKVEGKDLVQVFVNSVEVWSNR
jgi:hypothetical protein